MGHGLRVTGHGRPKQRIRALAHDTVKRIVAAYHPEKVILFGSSARGTPRADSDIDLLVVKRQPKERRLVDRIGAILDIVPFGTPVEPIVLTPSEISARLRAHDFFLQEVFASGRVLYEKPSARRSSA